MSHFNAWGNFSQKKVSQPTTAQKPGVATLNVTAPYTGSLGIFYNTSHFNGGVKITYKDKVTPATMSGMMVGSQQDYWYTYNPSMTTVDLDFSYRLNKYTRLFLSCNNVFNVQKKDMYADTLGLKAAYMQYANQYDNGARISFGTELVF